MRSPWMPGALVLVTLLAAACQPKVEAEVDETTRAVDAEQQIIAQERLALDQWAAGNPMGYLEIDADDVTYFDDIAASTRVDGREAMRNYMTSLQGKIPPHQYELVDPKVQVYGDVGILTLRYHATDPEGNPLVQWKATSVYHWQGDQWQIVHAHWSIVKT